MLESDIVKSIMKELKARSPDGWFFKVHGGAFQTLGVPDIVGVYRGRFVAMEVKRPKVGRLTAIQEATLGRIARAGGVAAVVTSADEARAVIEEVETCAITP